MGSGKVKTSKAGRKKMTSNSSTGALSRSVRFEVPLNEETKETREERFMESENKQSREKPELFTPSSARCTPKITQRPTYIRVQQRVDVSRICGSSTIVRPNQNDMLRRIAIIVHKHIETCEERFSRATDETMESVG